MVSLWFGFTFLFTLTGTMYYLLVSSIHLTHNFSNPLALPALCSHSDHPIVRVTLDTGGLGELLFKTTARFASHIVAVSPV